MEQEILTIPEDRVCFVVVVVVFTTCHIDKYGKHFEHSMILQSSSIFVIFIEHAKIQRGGAMNKPVFAV